MLAIVDNTPETIVRYFFSKQTLFNEISTHNIPSIFVELWENGCEANPNVFVNIGVKDKAAINRYL